ncbi:MAG TPA: RNA polymerase factor sigma-54, partial [Gammaproteobacteria bacterium]|nr:RNA polymerase factor sigma-54 [Gammaproteobacteria bacterium]
MKPSLQLRVSQNLTMTPQLQQAIRLLQLSSMELQSEIQDILESNMMLELDEEDGGDQYESRAEEDTGGQEEMPGMDNETIPEDLPVDSAWEDIYDNPPVNTSLAGDSGFYENQDSGETTLREHLMWQLNLTTLNEQDAAIATAIIDALDDDGYLACSLEDISGSLGDDVDVELPEVEAVLHMVQSMDPAGVGARDLRECLLLQLSQCSPDTPYLDKAQELVSRYLELMGSRDFNQLLRRLKTDRDTLQMIISLIQSLHPRPGSIIQSAKTEYIIPDVYVKKEKGMWKVELNSDAIPQLRINPSYVNMIRRADNSSENTSLKNHLQEARWFIKSLRSRSETLLRVA